MQISTFLWLKAVIGALLMLAGAILFAENLPILKVVAVIIVFSGTWHFVCACGISAFLSDPDFFREKKDV